jgi:hypothetical protein
MAENCEVADGIPYQGVKAGDRRSYSAENLHTRGSSGVTQIALRGIEAVFAPWYPLYLGPSNSVQGRSDTLYSSEKMTGAAKCYLFL